MTAHQSCYDGPPALRGFPRGKTPHHHQQTALLASRELELGRDRQAGQGAAAILTVRAAAILTVRAAAILTVLPPC